MLVAVSIVVDMATVCLAVFIGYRAGYIKGNNQGFSEGYRDGSLDTEWLSVVKKV